MNAEARLMSRMRESGGGGGVVLAMKVGAAAGLCWMATAHKDTIRKALMKSLKV